MSIVPILVAVRSDINIIASQYKIDAQDCSCLLMQIYIVFSKSDI